MIKNSSFWRRRLRVQYHMAGFNYNGPKWPVTRANKIERIFFIIVAPSEGLPLRWDSLNILMKGVSTKTLLNSEDGRRPVGDHCICLKVL